MRVATARMPSWPQPLRYQSVRIAYPIHPVRLGQTSMGFGSTGQTLSTSGTLVSTAGTLMSLAAIPYVGWVAAAVGAILSIAGGFFGGKPQLSHEQREAKEIGTKLGPAASGFAAEIQATQTPEDLWRVIVAYQSGYVGGTSPVAISVGFGDAGPPASVFGPGEIILPSGYASLQEYQRARGYSSIADVGGTFPTFAFGKPNEMYPVLSMAAALRVMTEHPDWLNYTSVQAGVTPSLLSPMNTGVNNVILNQLARFRAAGISAIAATGPDQAAVSTWIGQAYQQLLGRAPTSAETAAALGPLMARQITPEQFVQSLLMLPEFRARLATAAPAASQATYWWQGAMAAPSALVDGQSAPVSSTLPALAPMAAAVIPSAGFFTWLGQHPYWALGVGGLGVILLAASQPNKKRRR